MANKSLSLSLLTMAIGMALASHAQAQSAGASEAAARLASATGNKAVVSYNAATGTARFVRVPTGTALAAGAARASTDALKQRDALQFLGNYANLFGITNAASELKVAKIAKDQLGRSSVVHQQVFNGVPVFGGELKAHYDQADRLVAVSGAFVPEIAVNTTPKLTAADATARATAAVKATATGRTDSLRTSQPVLQVYRTGLLKGVPGNSHLVWQVTVSNGLDVREFVYVDAHSGKVVEQFSGIHEGMNRRAFDAAGSPHPGPNYPNNPFWVEGNAFPTASAEANNMILASAEIYDLFKKGFGRDSFDGNGAQMDSIFNRGDSCPNASWNGVYISFCPGTTTDDVTAHEWGHAYTEYTHGLIYAFQPGALNEAYSDIWGETVDRLNGRGGDTPDQIRTAGACTVSTPNTPSVTVNSPSAIAGLLPAGSASFGAQQFSLTGNVTQVKEANGSQSQGCTVAAFTQSNVAGQIAFVDRGTCTFLVKAQNAQAAGAIGLIIGNNQGGTAVSNMSGSDPAVTLAAAMVSQNDGTGMKAQFAANVPVNVTLTRGGFGADNSVRWLMGEDSSAFGGAIRDMYNPVCYGQPGKVSDRQYVCAAVANNTTDQGGVHTNSGVPNHAYALLVDGGSYNGQTIASIGLTKAAHIYYRAQTVYQGPTTDFAGHADALEQSCRDLTGASLNGLKTGTPSGEVISAADCTQVAKAMVAVEMRNPPTQCNFPTLLAKNPPPLCPAGNAVTVASDGFEGGRRGSLKWLTSSVAASAGFLPRSWGIVNGLPGGRAGSAMYASDPNFSCSGDQSGMLRLESPEITVPATANMDLRMAFDHYIATENGWDGGNLKISVNGGSWTLVSASNFIYNPYNATMFTAAQGNTSPLAGQAGFTGTDGGSLGGSWGRSIINLAPYANPGDRIRLRFESAVDSCSGITGWYVDDVNVYQCARVAN